MLTHSWVASEDKLKCAVDTLCADKALSELTESRICCLGTELKKPTKSSFTSARWMVGCTRFKKLCMFFHSWGVVASPMAPGHTNRIMRRMAWEAALSSSLMPLLEYEIIVLPFRNSFLRLRKINPTGRVPDGFMPHLYLFLSRPGMRSRTQVDSCSDELSTGSETAGSRQVRRAA